ncbi:hypothetical protein N2152v2_007384 [Parachlorella kessleri]
MDVRVVLQTLLGATPSDWNLVVDDSTPTSSPEQPHSMAISWHMEAQGRALPLLSGLSFYRVDSCGKICYIKESAEQLVKAQRHRGKQCQQQGSSRLSRSNQSSSSSDSGAGSSMLDSMCGVWLKDIEASDMASYDRALQLMQLGGLQRTTAMQLLEGIELERSGAKVAIRYLTVVPFFKVTEEFSLGHPTGMSRRDLKPGRQQATASTGDLGEFTVDISWGPPNTGEALS